jgi:hypothetical protein
VTWEGAGFVDRHARLLWSAAGEPDGPIEVHDGLRGDLERALHGARDAGLCEITEVAVRDPAFREALLSVRARLDELPVRVRLLVDPEMGDPRKLPRTGDPWLDLAGVFVRADPTGVALVRADDLASRLDAWAAAGWRLAVEAHSPRAVDATVEAFESIYGADCAAAAPSLHLPDDLDVDARRLATLGIECVLDPHADRPDPERWHELLESGARLAARAPRPLRALQALAVRELGVDRVLTVLTDPASGTIVLSDDPRRVAEDELAQIEIEDVRPAG